jgi:hypothetical protein
MKIEKAFDFSRALNSGFEALKKEPLWILLAAFLLLLADGGGGNGGGFDVSAFDDTPEIMIPALLFLVGCSCLVPIFQWLFGAWVRPGALRLFAATLRGQNTDGVLFSGADRFMDMALNRLIKGLVGILCLLVGLMFGGPIIGYGLMEGNEVFIIGGSILAVVIALPFIIYVTLGLLLSDYIVVFENKSAVESLKSSWELSSGNRLHLFLFLFVMGMINIIGLCFCCVGVVPAKAITDAGFVESYLLFTRGTLDEEA